MSRIKWFKLLLICLLLSNTSYILYTLSLNGFFLNLYYLFCEVIVFVATLILLQNIGRFLRIRKRYEPIVITSIVLFIVWQLCSCYLNGMLRGSVVARILCWPMVFLAIYALNLCEEDFTGIRKIVNFSCVFLAVLCVPLIYTHLFIMQRAGAVIFPTYLVLSMIPLLLLVNKKENAYKIIILILIFMAITTKRSGFFVAVVSLVVYYLFDNGMNISLNKKIERILKIAIMSVLAAFLLFVASKFVDISIIDRILEMKEDGGSGRNDIWSMVLLYYKNLRTHYQIVGRGYEGVSRYVMPQGKALSAHNDFLEVLFDYGKIGISLFVIIWLALIGYVKILRKSKYFSYALIIIISMFMLAMFSYLFIQSFVIQYYMIALSLIMRLHIERRKDNSGEGNISYCSNI